MGRTPFLSVIMPMYNAERYVREAIESIQKQTFDNFELIIVDDKSTDSSKIICEEIQQNDSRIKIITVEKNGGAGNARNIGIQEAKGEYITFIDSDDFIDCDLFFNAYQMIVQYDVDEVVWGMTEEYYDKNGNCYLKNKLNLPQTICQNFEQVKDIVIYLEEKTLFGYQWNCFYRIDILKTNKIRFEKVILYEDYFFNLEVIKHVKTLAIIEDTGYHYMKRQNDSITTRFVPEYFDLSKRRIDSMFQLYQHWNADSAEVRNILGNRYLRYILAGLTKSYDKRAKMTFRTRKTWLSNIKNDTLYGEISQKCRANQNILHILQFTINMKMWSVSLLIGKIVWIGKEKLPALFNKIRKFK